MDFCLYLWHFIKDWSGNDLRQATSTFNDYMKGLDGFGDKDGRAIQ